MSGPRVVSLLPAATEIVCALGLGDRLVGRSHECDWPPEIVADLPVCSGTDLPDRGSRAIDDAVRARVAEGLSIYTVDVARIAALEPDWILTQTQCDVCAVTEPELVAALADDAANPRGRRPGLLSLAPTSLADVWGDIDAVAVALGAPERSGPLRRALATRLAEVAEAVGGARRPSVVCLEWIDPPMAAGHWTPELVAVAGGRALLGPPGGRSPTLADGALAAADPDVLVVMPCGFTLERALRESSGLARIPGWTTLRAVREGRVFVADGNATFNRPGPRLVESAEILAEILHPAAFAAGHRGRAWQPL